MIPEASAGLIRSPDTDAASMAMELVDNGANAKVPLAEFAATTRDAPKVFPAHAAMASPSFVAATTRPCNSGAPSTQTARP